MARKICSAARARTIWCGQVIAPKARVRSAFSAQGGVEAVRAADHQGAGRRARIAPVAEFFREILAGERACRARRGRFYGLAREAGPRSPRPPRLCGLRDGGRAIRRSRAFRTRPDRCFAPSRRNDRRSGPTSSRSGPAFSRPTPISTSFIVRRSRVHPLFAGRSTLHIFSRL